MGPKINIEKAIDKAIVKYSLKEEPKLVRMFQEKDVTYPAHEVTLIALKDEKRIELYGRNKNEPWRYIHTYPLTASSGILGPKLRENDKQIPEGIYKLTAFNPFSAHHLSILINYPNHFDRLKGSLDGRKKLGGDIFLHGKDLSVGCLAVGDKAIDQLFLLVRRVGLDNVNVIIAPNDLRIAKAKTNTFAQPQWLPELYNNIKNELQKYPRHRLT